MIKKYKDTKKVYEIYMLKKIHLLISGKVQGVFYRLNVKQKAEELNLTGWVKNRSDGRVEILAEGEKEDLNKLIKWCYNGPKEARVEKVEVEWRDIGERRSVNFF